MAQVLEIVGLTLVSTALVWVGSRLLDRSAAQLSAYYGLPPVVQGAVVLAVGSSFPELSATLLATLLHDEFGLGLGTIIGSAVFNVLVIPAVSVLVAEDLRASRDLVFKESLFYMLSIAVLVITFALAVIYEPVAGSRLDGEVTRWMALAPLGLYGLYVFIQGTDVADHTDPRDLDVGVLREWAKLLAGVALILVAVEGLVRAALDLGALLNTPGYVWGLTIVAAATSLPDAAVSIQAAVAGRPVASLANVFGSNVFDLCVAVPAGVLVAGSVVVDFAAVVPTLGALTVATVLLFAFLRTDLEISRREAVGLLIAYAGFLAFALETGGVTNLV